MQIIRQVHKIGVFLFDSIQNKLSVEVDVKYVWLYLPKVDYLDLTILALLFAHQEGVVNAVSLGWFVFVNLVEGAQVLFLGVGCDYAELGLFVDFVYL